MSHNEVLTKTRTGLGQGSLRGYASGVLITGFFGLAWLSWGTSDIQGSATLPVTIVAIAVTLALFAGAYHLFRLARTAPEETRDDPTRANTMRKFGWVVAIEWIGLGLIAGLLGGFGLAQWIPAVICLGVGVHFFPLGTLFGLPLYHYTGAGLCTVAIATMIAVPAGAPTVLWQALPGIGSALILWTTSVCLVKAGTQGAART